MATSTYQTYLMYKTGTGSTYTKLVDIKDYPDLGGAPEMLETTTLSDGMQTYTPGIQSLDAMTFSCNYSSEDYATIKTLEGESDDIDFAIYFGSTTAPDDKFTFSGKISVFVTGGGVNEVRGMTVTIAPSTVITKATA
jgi:hypothetical protein